MDKKTRKKTLEQAPPELVAHAKDLVRVGELTVEVRELEAQLDAKREERREAMKAAVKSGASVYAVAKSADTSHSSAWRIVNKT